MPSLKISIDSEKTPHVSQELADEMFRRKGDVGRWRFVFGGMSILVTPDADKSAEAAQFEAWLTENGFLFERMPESPD